MNKNEHKKYCHRFYNEQGQMVRFYTLKHGRQKKNIAVQYNGQRISEVAISKKQKLKKIYRYGFTDKGTPLMQEKIKHEKI